MILNKDIKCFTVTLLMVAVTGCAGAVVGASSAVVGVTAAEERSFGNAIDDTVIETKVESALLQEDIDHLFTRVDVDVHEGRVLLTGSVLHPDHRMKAVQMAWQPEGVKEVINEIQVEGNALDPKVMAQDAWINTQLSGQILVAKGVRSINYNIEVVNGTLYLIGVAQDSAELNKVLDLARRVKGVKKVVNHVRLKDSPLRGINQKMN